MIFRSNVWLKIIILVGFRIFRKVQGESGFEERTTNSTQDGSGQLESRFETNGFKNFKGLNAKERCTISIGRIFERSLKAMNRERKRTKSLIFLNFRFFVI